MMKMFVVNCGFWRAVVLIFFGALMLTFITYKLCFINFKVIGEKIECSTNSPFPFEYVCKLETIDNGTQYWSFEGQIPDGLEMPGLLAQITTSKMVSNDWMSMYFQNETIDVCKHSGGRLSKAMINTFLPALTNPEVSNLNRPCPFKGPIYLRKFVLDESLKLPRNLGGKWKVEMKFYAEGFEEITFDMNVFVRLEPVGLGIF